MPTVNEVKEKFLEFYFKRISRQGSAELAEWLEKETDFFTAPASTKYHLSEPAGLCIHSLHVYSRLRKLYAAEKYRALGAAELTPEEEEKIAVAGLLHDVCKTNFYTQEYRNRKTYDADKVRTADRFTVKHDAGGDFIWETVPVYTINDTMPYGHGEKSVMLVEKYMRLTDEERIAIRWHMGGFDCAVKGGENSISQAYERYPFAVLLNIADMQAAYLDEGDFPLFAK